MKKNNEYLTNAARQNQVTIQNGGVFPNLKNIPGDSVDEHKDQEVANQIITGDEIKQQNENLLKAPHKGALGRDQPIPG
ncbi:hypothetical protein [Robertmurraya sp. P23]|uniref:hypothetical protein n=1 Tax=Robertmurraya sp. P23 TaxID=3436931 RepID=UPI003D99C247